MVPESNLEYARLRGDAVHYGCELFDRDELDWDTVQKELIGYIKAWQSFRQQTGFEPELIEHRVFHPGLRYAGTVDRAGLLSGVHGVLDIKAVAQMYPATGLQLAAYQQALHQSLPLHPHRFEARWSVQLKADGTFRFHAYEDPNDWPSFVSLLSAINWANKHKVRIHHDPV